MELALVVMGFLTPSRESGEATQKVHQRKFNLIVVGVVECTHESYVFSHSVATSSAECNRCSPRPAWTAGDLRHLTAIFAVTVQWLESFVRIEWVFVGSPTRIQPLDLVCWCHLQFPRSVLSVACGGTGSEDVVRARY